MDTTIVLLRNVNLGKARKPAEILARVARTTGFIVGGPTSIFRLVRACRIRWNSAAAHQRTRLYQWNTPRRNRMGKNRCARWWKADCIPANSALDARALRDARRLDELGP